MAAIYLKHPVHGTKVAISQAEAEYDKEHGWVVYDPAAPVASKAKPAVPPVVPPVVTDPPPPAPPVVPPAADGVPSFLAPTPPVAPVESDLPADFPGREALIGGGLSTWASVVGKTRDELVAVKGIGPKTADAILAVMES